MAGSYADVPGYRFPMSIDGTIHVTYKVPTGSIFNVSQPHIQMLDRDHANITGSNYVIYQSYTGGTDNYLVFIFPELRNVTGYFIAKAAGGTNTIETSVNTTNGLDGTWTVGVANYISHSHTISDISPQQRVLAQTTSLLNVRAVRIRVNSHVSIVHIYGSIPTTESPDRLRITDTSDNDIAAQLDFGNIQQGNSSTKQFKVLNNSATQTANDISVSINVVTDATPTLVGQYQISTDNVAYASTVNIGNLAPGASSTLYVRNSVASNAQLGPWAGRIIANPTSWS